MKSETGQAAHTPHDGTAPSAGQAANAGLTAPARPRAWNWFLYYCILMSVVCLFLVGSALGAIFDDGGGPSYAFFTGPGTRGQTTPEELAAQRRSAICGLVAGGAALVAFAAAPFAPRNKLGWGIGMLVIGLGNVLAFVAPCLLPLTMLLAIGWCRPSTRSYYGYPTSGVAVAAAPASGSTGKEQATGRAGKLSGFTIAAYPIFLSSVVLFVLTSPVVDAFTSLDAVAAVFAACVLWLVGLTSAVVGLVNRPRAWLARIALALFLSPLLLIFLQIILMLFGIKPT